MAESLPTLDVLALRKEAVERAERAFARAKTTQEKHDARLWLQRARRALPQEGQDGAQREG